MLTVVCWLWQGWRPIYKAEHVNRLVDKLAEHLTIPHRVVCATDSPKGINCDTVQIPVIHGFDKWPRALPNCYRRLFLFSGEARNAFGERCLSIDLDSIIVGNMDSLITGDHFKIMRGGVNPYNGSLWQVTPGWRPELWHELDLDLARKAGRNTFNGRRVFGSDQVVMAHKIKDAPMWGAADGVYQYSAIGKEMPENAKVVFFAGKVKPWDAACRFRDLY